MNRRLYQMLLQHRFFIDLKRLHVCRR